MSDRYGRDVLAGDWRVPPRGRTTDLPATTGLVVEEVTSGFVGAILGVEKIGGQYVARLQDRRGTVRGFPLGPGYHVNGKPVRLVPVPTAPAPRAPARTASGSVAVAGARARVARASRLFVEGTHDAELVERVWGADLRVEGVVVEVLHGVDDLAGLLADFGPTPRARAGVLVDHLVTGTKETRVVAQTTARFGADRVLIVGHPYVDVWQAIKPARVGLEAWPVIPRGQDWKSGIAAALGLPHTTTEDIGLAWKHVLGRVRSYADLEPSFSGRVEELIDFVTVGPAG